MILRLKMYRQSRYKFHKTPLYSRSGKYKFAWTVCKYYTEPESKSGLKSKSPDTVKSGVSTKEKQTIINIVLR